MKAFILKTPPRHVLNCCGTRIEKIVLDLFINYYIKGKAMGSLLKKRLNTHQ